MVNSKPSTKFSEIYQTFRPIILVLLFAALIVFINSYPNVQEIADNTADYRQQVKNQQDMNESALPVVPIAPPEAPSLPNTITPIISPEKVNEFANPTPKPSPSDISGDNKSKENLTDISRDREPSLGIKLLTGFLNVAPLILIAAIGGFGIYLLFKYKKHFTLRSMFSSAIAIVAISAIVFFGYIILNFTEFLYKIEIVSNLAFVIILPVAVVSGILISYSVISRRTTIFRRNMGLAFSGALMGSFLAAFLPFWIVFILLIAIALFDIYSVKYGPIKKILELEKQANSKPPVKTKDRKVIYRTLNNSSDSNLRVNDSAESIVPKSKNLTTIANPTTNPLSNNTNLNDISQLKSGAKSASSPNIGKQHLHKSKHNANDEDFDLMLMFDNPEWSLGLGDFVIYSMFTSAVLTYWLLYLPYYIFYTPLLGLILPWIIFVICALGLLLGFYITLKLLQKYEYLPGLPITIGSGFLVFIICIIIMQIINYLLFNEFVIII
jgi:hypothetical protein